MTAWEYLIVSLPTFGEAKVTQGESASVEMLNREGAAGWEAVGMVTLGDSTVAVLLKRPAPLDYEASRGLPGHR